jgi:hypothetical protein
MYAAGGIGFVRPPPRRAMATGRVYAAISEESDGDEVSARWARIAMRVRARATAQRFSDVRQACAPATAVRAIRSLAAPTPVRFSSPEESKVYVPFKGVLAYGRGPAPFTPRPRSAGVRACADLAPVAHGTSASIEHQEACGAQAQAAQYFMALQSSGGTCATPSGVMQAYGAQAQNQAQALQFIAPPACSPALGGDDGTVRQLPVLRVPVRAPCWGGGVRAPGVRARRGVLLPVIGRGGGVLSSGGGGGDPVDVLRFSALARRSRVRRAARCGGRAWIVVRQLCAPSAASAAAGAGAGG